MNAVVLGAAGGMGVAREFRRGGAEDLKLLLDITESNVFISLQTDCKYEAGTTGTTRFGAICGPRL